MINIRYFLGLLAGAVVGLFGFCALTPSNAQQAYQPPPLQPDEINKAAYQVIHDRAARHVTVQHLQECQRKATAVPATFSTAAYKLTTPLHSDSRFTCVHIGMLMRTKFLEPPVAYFVAKAELESGFGGLIPGPKIFWCRFRYVNNAIKIDDFGVGVSGPRNILAGCRL